jgi:hypothetical protein
MPNSGHDDGDHHQATSPVNSTQNSAVMKISESEKKEKSKATVRHSRRAHNAIGMRQLKASKISKILGERRRGRGWQYRVLWAGGGSDDCSWLAGKTLKAEGAEALSNWEKQKQMKALTL